MLEIREHPPPISKTLMASSLGGGAGSPGVPTTFLEDVDGAPPWEAMMEIQERSPPFSKTSMVGPLRGDVKDSGVSTTYLEDIDGGPPRPHGGV
jgi:hypothetical protein